MKRFAAAAAALVMVFALATSVSAQISGTAHDFSGQAWNTGGEICQVCHTPHNANTAVTSSGPLWNHDVSGATFGAYTGYDMQASPGQPTGTSLLCLSCHDGTVALDSFGGATGTNFIAPPDSLGIDLSDDHPVGFAYTAAANELQATTFTGGSGLTVSDILASGNVECSSCHDVHDGAGLGATGYLLQVANTASQLCLTCHIK